MASICKKVFNFAKLVTGNLICPLAKNSLKPEELKDFVGCFLTGSAAEVTPVSCIADNQFKVCKTIIDLNESYQALVRKK